MHRGKSDPDWPDLVKSWKETQLALRKKMRIEPLSPLPRFVAGADAAFSEDKQKVLAAAVVYDRTEKRIVEASPATRPIEFPYVPGPIPHPRANPAGGYRSIAGVYQFFGNKGN